MASTIRTPRLELVPFDSDALQHLLAGDRERAQRTLGLELPEEFPTEGEIDGFLPIQLHRMRDAPDRRDWMARLMVTEDKDVAGHCGFHGPPETIGRAEIGYTVFTRFRGQGYAKESARALVDWALAQGEREVYATVAPDNAASLAVVRAIGFTQIGTQVDEVDGLELVFVVRAGA